MTRWYNRSSWAVITARQRLREGQSRAIKIHSQCRKDFFPPINYSIMCVKSSQIALIHIDSDRALSTKYCSWDANANVQGQIRSLRGKTKTLQCSAIFSWCSFFALCNNSELEKFFLIIFMPYHSQQSNLVELLDLQTLPRSIWVFPLLLSSASIFVFTPRWRRGNKKARKFFRNMIHKMIQD